MLEWCRLTKLANGIKLEFSKVILSLIKCYEMNWGISIFGEYRQVKKS